MVAILISTEFGGVGRIRGKALINGGGGGGGVFRCGYPNVRRLFETRRLSEDIWYANENISAKNWTIANTNIT